MRWLAIPPLAFVALAISVAAPADLVITKEIALKAIMIFRDDPLSEDGRGAAGLIIMFVDKNHDVLVALNKKVFPVFGAPGVAQNETSLLLAAFAAGNVDSQLLRGVKKDDPYAGDLQMIQTYRQLQKKNPNLKIPAVEKMAEMEQRGELKRYLSSKES
jgi:hypothetical protein